MGLFDDYMGHVIELADANEEIVILDCDVGKCFKSFRFQNLFPDRYFNFGICEQNTMSIAAGMAKKGCIPIVQGFASFLSTRSLDQLRNSICYPNMKVVIIAQKAGISDSYGGATHQSIDDIGIISSIPNITVFSPSNRGELVYALDYAIKDNKGPTYIRVENNLSCEMEAGEFQSGVNKVSDGNELALVTTGNMVNYCKPVVEELHKKGLSISLISVNKVKPIESRLSGMLEKMSKVAFLDVGNTYSGFGTILSGRLLDKLNEKSVQIWGIDDAFTESGKYEDILKKNDLDTDALERKIMAFVNL